MFKKLILVGIGVGVAVAFIGFDTVGHFMGHARESIRAQLTTPEMDLQAKLSEAKELSRRCEDSMTSGRESLHRLDAMIAQRGTELERREALVDRDRKALEIVRTMLSQTQKVYYIKGEPYSRKALNRDALLRAKSYSSETEMCGHLGDTLEELKGARAQTAAEIDNAMSEHLRLREDINCLKAELENLKARRAVAQTREEAGYVFDRSAFDKTRDKIAEIRATIMEQNKRLDFYGRNRTNGRGLIPIDVDVPHEDGIEAIDRLLGASHDHDHEAAHIGHDRDHEAEAEIALSR